MIKTSSGFYMIELIKTKVWNILKEKDVSLALIYNREGEILWHRGREIKGKHTKNGYGFSRLRLSSRDFLSSFFSIPIFFSLDIDFTLYVFFYI